PSSSALSLHDALPILTVERLGDHPVQRAAGIRQPCLRLPALAREGRKAESRRVLHCREEPLELPSAYRQGLAREILATGRLDQVDRKSTRLNSSHVKI